MYKAGELAQEMYFIIKGVGVIHSEKTDVILGILKKNDFFGESAIIEEKATVRNVSDL